MRSRCNRCGDEIEQDELGWFCRGCDHRTDSNGRRTRSQPTKGQKALRRFHDKQAQQAADAIGNVFGEGTVAEQQTFFRRPLAPRGRRTEKLWCTPCNALLVRRAGKTMCWRCGIVWEPT